MYDPFGPMVNPNDVCSSLGTKDVEEIAIVGLVSSYKSNTTWGNDFFFATLSMKDLSNIVVNMCVHI